MLALTVLFIWLGDLIAGRQGMIFAFILAAAMNFISYWFSDKIVLAMYRAKQVKQGDLPELSGIVGNLARKANIPMPKLYVIENSMPNAFATGRDPSHAAVAVTTGILEILEPKELEGVIAHELSHVTNRDILISSIAATLAGAIFMLSSMMRYAAIFGGVGGRDDDNRGGLLGLLVGIIVAPIAATIIQLAISRSREYAADASGARLSGNPLGLAHALRKLDTSARARPVEVNPATAHMFIVNPLSGRTLMGLFSTHPPIEERIKRLEKMAVEKSGMNIPKIIY
jgi:heat shock protein HtpX